MDSISTQSCRHFSPEICDTTDQGWEEKAVPTGPGDWINGMLPMIQSCSDFVTLW